MRSGNDYLKSIKNDGRQVFIDAECVGCNLCHHVCPVTGCITMVPQPAKRPPVTWQDHPNNPLRQS